MTLIPIHVFQPSLKAICGQSQTNEGFNPLKIPNLHFIIYTIVCELPFLSSTLLYRILKIYLAFLIQYLKKIFLYYKIR